jgi:hypothetical protein
MSAELPESTYPRCLVSGRRRSARAIDTSVALWLVVVALTVGFTLGALVSAVV